jgi:hypothetical protein
VLVELQTRELAAGVELARCGVGEDVACAVMIDHLPVHLNWRLVYEVDSPGNRLHFARARLGQARLGRAILFEETPALAATERANESDNPCPSLVEEILAIVSNACRTVPPDRVADVVREPLRHLLTERFRDGQILTASHLNAFQACLDDFSRRLTRIEKGTGYPRQSRSSVSGSPGAEDAG